MTYRLELKGADWPDPAVPEDAVEDPNDPTAPKWSGDLYQEGDASDPIEAFAAFTGEEGLTAWLDVSPADGTVTGWVQDGEDVYRYSDPKAWALDVDGAGMVKAGEFDGGAPEGEEPVEGEEPIEGDELDADGDLPAEEGTEEVPDGDEPAEDIAVDDTEGHDPNGDTPAVPGDGTAPENPADAPAGDEDEAMDPADDNFYTRMKKQGEKKSLAIRVRKL